MFKYGCKVATEFFLFPLVELSKTKARQVVPLGQLGYILIFFSFPLAELSKINAPQEVTLGQLGGILGIINLLTFLQTLSTSDKFVITRFLNFLLTDVQLTAMSVLLNLHIAK